MNELNNFISLKNNHRYSFLDKKILLFIHKIIIIYNLLLSLFLFMFSY
jgi:hypothetical protein